MRVDRAAGSMVALVAACALSLSACGGGGGDSAAPAHDARSATAADAERAPVPTTAPPSEPRPFSDATPWYNPVTQPRPADPGAYAFGAEIAAEIAQYYQHVALNDRQYSPTVYEVSAEQPAVPVVMWDCQQKNSAPEQARFAAVMAAVPIPDDAVVPPDTDGSVVVWQPATDTVWETWKTRRIDGQWQACWGGKLERASESVGTYPWPYGASASGISQLAGLVTPDDLAAGRIDHAVALGVVRTRTREFVWPANRTDGRFTEPSSIPIGTRLRLDPTIDLTTLNLTPLGRMVAVALQEYGAIVRESSGSVAVYAESSAAALAAGQPDEYAPYFGGKPHWAQFDGIPWDRLYVVADPAAAGGPG